MTYIPIDRTIGVKEDEQEERIKRIKFFKNQFDNAFDELIDGNAVDLRILSHHIECLFDEFNDAVNAQDEIDRIREHNKKVIEENQEKKEV